MESLTENNIILGTSWIGSLMMKRIGKLVVSSLLLGCSPNKEAYKPNEERGRELYLINCTSCHNSNPKLSGSIGPALAGTQGQVTMNKVLSGDYPVGYNPKRNTNNMPVFNYLTTNDVALIAIYLEGVE